MANQRKISYEEFVDDLYQVLRGLTRGEADEVVVVLDNRQEFTVTKKQRSSSTEYEPARVLAAFHDAQGMLGGIDDIEAWKRYLKEARGQDSKGRPGDE